MEKKPSKKSRLIEILVITFVIIGSLLVLMELYQNVSAKLNEKKSIGFSVEQSFYSNS